MISGRLRDTKLIVDLGAIKHNIHEQQKLLAPNSKILAVVKANAYGNGLVPVAQTAISAGATGACVAILDEALELRDSGITSLILVLGITPVENAHIAAEAGVSLTVASLKLSTVVKPIRPIPESIPR